MACLQPEVFFVSPFGCLGNFIMYLLSFNLVIPDVIVQLMGSLGLADVKDALDTLGQAAS